MISLGTFNILTSVTLLICIFITNVHTNEDDQVHKCPPQLPSTCKCGSLELHQAEPMLLPYYGKLVVNCTATNLTDASILKFIPDWTQVLIFNGNNFPELPANVFDDSDDSSSQKTLSSLETIDLSGNQITSIRGKTFHLVKNVKRLILDNNKLLITGEHFKPRIFSNFQSLRELSLTAAFDQHQRASNFIENFITSLIDSNLTNLAYLDLSDNGIQNIPEESAFCSLPSLKRLSLAGNSLTSVTFNVSCTPLLTDLDLSDNYISNIDSKAIAFLSEKSNLQVNLVRNPLKCDCQIVPFHRWLMNSNTTVKIIGKSTLQCASGEPESNNGKLFASLTDDNFDCSPEALTDDESLPNYVAISLTITIIVILISLVIVSIFIALNRESMIEIYNRFVDSIAGKQEYTCLNQDATTTPAPEGNLFIKYQRQAPPHQQTIRATSIHESDSTVREESV